VSAPYATCIAAHLPYLLRKLDDPISKIGYSKILRLMMGEIGPDVSLTKKNHWIRIGMDAHLMTFLEDHQAYLMIPHHWIRR
jgi:hypothetical protein